MTDFYIAQICTGRIPQKITPLLDLPVIPLIVLWAHCGCPIIVRSEWTIWIDIANPVHNILQTSMRHIFVLCRL